MFKSISDAHKDKQIKKKQNLKELEEKIINEYIPKVSEEIFNDLNKGSEQIILNQKEIDKKCKNVRDEWQKFNNELNKWSLMINDLDKAVKEIGDIRSWSLHVQGQIQSTIEQLDSK